MNTNPRAEPAQTETQSEPENADEIGSLRVRGDIDALLELAKTYRAGSAAGGRDLPKCLAAYRAAAELGSAEAEYAVALFVLSGGVVPQDLKEGATRLRAAAEKGSIPAKVYLGNLYELGIHYKADAEKADVWYRNAARSAGLDGDPLSLAELGCVRHVLAVNAEPGTSEADKTRLLQRARAHGYGLRIRDSDPGDRPTFLDALQSAEAPVGRTTAANVVPTTLAALDAKTAMTAMDPAPKKRPAGPSQAGIGLAAFGYALLFVVAGIGGGYAAMLGAHELVLHGTVLPAGIGARFELVFPIAFGVIGVLPTLLVYRFFTVVKALVIGAAVGGAGWIAWGTGSAALHHHRHIQALVFAIAGFAAGLLVLGLIGGTKKRPAQRLR